MLSDEQLKALCAEHGFVFGMRERQLLRAVESVTRTNQIAIDIGLVQGEQMFDNTETESDTAYSNALHDAERALREQLP